MKIKTNYNADGARTDVIVSSSEEVETINNAILIVKNRCIEAVLKFVNTAEILPYQINKTFRAYA